MAAGIADSRDAHQRRVHWFLHQLAHDRPARGGEDCQRTQGEARNTCSGRTGSAEVKKLAEQEGLHEIFKEAGFEWREAGCSMCLAMNPDKLNGREVSASSSNRNFIGRQGSPGGRTLLMSPAMVAAAALNGKVVDVREYQ